MAFESILYVTDGGISCACLRADCDTVRFHQQGSVEPHQMPAKS